MLRQVLIYPGEDGYWVAECSTLTGCLSQGRTKESVVKNIKEAIDLHIEVMQERGEMVPDDRLEAVLVVV